MVDIPPIAILVNIEFYEFDKVASLRMTYNKFNQLKNLFVLATLISMGRGKPSLSLVWSLQKSLHHMVWFSINLFSNNSICGSYIDKCAVRHIVFTIYNIFLAALFT